MTELQCQQWEQTRERGEAAYCIKRVLVLGGIAFAVHAYRDAFVKHLPLINLLSDSIEPILSGCFVGFVEGLREWSSNEKRYLRAMSQEDSLNGSTRLRYDNSQRGTLNGNIL